MKPLVIPRAEHTISRKLIDDDALKTMYRLLNGGYKAYLVGGGVRDLLLGRTPKDFDIGTDAHPNKIKRLFRNCRLVGRRFRLAHIHFGDKILEVSTFRRRSEYQDEDGDRLIRSDNTFGTPEEDAYRRDFTINGLFYDLETFSVIDWVGGIEHLKAREIHAIGDPDVRLEEDPVRIIRAIKFAARLDFTIEPGLWQAMQDRAPDIHRCAKARLLEEIYRLLRQGAAAASFQLMQECGLLAELLPEVDEYLQDLRENEKDGDRVFWQYLEVLDQMRGEGVQPSNALLLGALAVHLLGLAAGDLTGDEVSRDLGAEVDELTREWVDRLGVAKRDREKLAHMLRAQPRFLKTRGRRFRPRSFVTKHYYPDAEALFALGVRATGLEVESLEKWRAIREETVGDGEGEPEPTTRRRRRGGRRRRGREEDAVPEEASEPRGRRSSSTKSGSAEPASEQNGDGESRPHGRRPRRRRRRR